MNDMIMYWRLRSCCSIAISRNLKLVTLPPSNEDDHFNVKTKTCVYNKEIEQVTCFKLAR